MIHRLKPCFFLALILAGFLPTPANAQDKTAPPDDQVKERLAFIVTALDSGRPSAKVWYYGWIAANSAAAIGQWGLSIAHWNDFKPTNSSPNGTAVRDRALAKEMLVGGTITAAGVCYSWLDPFLPAFGSNKLGALSENTPEERREKLLRAEDLLRQCAQEEKNERGWGNHLWNIGLNAATGLMTVLVFNQTWTHGLLAFLGSEAASLLTIYTQPQRAIHDLKNYEIKYDGQQGTYLPEAQSDMSWTLSLYPGGIGLRLRF